jgi:threonine dehydratase
MAGYGTIGLEILEDFSNVDAILMPFGGGANCCGVGSAIRVIKPTARAKDCFLTILFRNVIFFLIYFKT